MAEQQEHQQEQPTELIKPSFPVGRVKKIMKIDKDINRITSEALFLVSGATDLFLQFLAEKSAQVATEKKRKIVKLDHLRLAVKRHQPSREFLLDSLPVASSQPSDQQVHRTVKDKGLPRNTRRIDSFFSKPKEKDELDCGDDVEKDVTPDDVEDS